VVCRWWSVAFLIKELKALAMLNRSGNVPTMLAVTAVFLRRWLFLLWSLPGGHHLLVPLPNADR